MNQSDHGVGSSRRTKRRGASFLEVMIAVLIMGFAASMFATVFPAMAQSIVKDRHQDVAANACQAQLEYWRNVGYSSLPTIVTGSSSTSQSFTAPTDLPTGSGSTTFTRITSSYSSTTTDTGLIQVSSSCSWQGTGRDLGTVTLTTLLAE